MAIIIVDSEGPSGRSTDETPRKAPYLAARRSPTQLLRAAGRDNQPETKEAK